MLCRQLIYRARWLRPLLAVLVLVTVMMQGAVRAAAPAAAPETWAGSWPVVSSGDTVTAALDGLMPAAGSALTLSDDSGTGSLTSAVHDMGHPFMALGAVWEADVPPGADVQVVVRLSADGASWGPWQALTREELGREGDGSYHSDLLFGWGRYVECRVELERGTGGAAPALKSLKLVAIDASQGPRAEDVEPAPVSALAEMAPPPIISRAGWGANENWMTWDPEYAPAVKCVIHHTTGNNLTVDADPAAFVRSIYYYHAVTLGWGDIGYNFLVDRQGRIYEGRYGGDNVIGGHALVYNRGSIGIAILGDYSTASVPYAAVTGLENLLAWECGNHGIDPLGSGWLYDGVFPNIMGHRDCNFTTCPGDRAYAIIPQIRQDVAQQLATVPQLTVSSPEPEQWLSGAWPIAWQPGTGTTQVTVAVDGQVQATLPGTSTGWVWDTIHDADGAHALRVTGSNALGQSVYVDVPVRVDNTPPSGSVEIPSYGTEPMLTLDMSCQDCDEVQFSWGWRWEGEDLYHQMGIAVDDPAAANGRAWQARVGVDGWGAWYGPYLCGLPAPGDYEAVFWLRSGRNDLAEGVAQIDVTDDEGQRGLGGPMPLPTNLFASTSAYQPFSLPFHYPGAGPTCQGTTPNGLEWRTWYQPNVADLWLDRVEVWSARQPYSGSMQVTPPVPDGRYTLSVRFLDAAGNPSASYTHDITLDRAQPVWGQPGSQGLPVSDATSGLSASAAYAVASDGLHWGPWKSVTLSLAADGLTGTLPVQASWAGNCVRARVVDLAGNVSYCAPIRWPSDSSNPVYCWWDSCGARNYLPLAIH